MAPLPSWALLASALLAAAVDLAAAEMKHSHQPHSVNKRNANEDPVTSRFSQNTGSEYSGRSSENTPKARHHSDTNQPHQSLTCTANCPLCPTCPAPICPSPCPSIPKCPEPHSCPTPCAACPTCPACKKLIPPGYEHFQGVGYYRLHTVPLTWVEAKATCEREGAHLAIINSQEEANVLKTLYGRDTDIGVVIFLGFHDLYKEGRYVTIFGAPLSSTGYTSWNTGQPDNAGNNENCGSMFPNGGLNDMNCASKVGFICELPS